MFAIREDRKQEFFRPKVERRCAHPETKIQEYSADGRGRKPEENNFFTYILEKLRLSVLNEICCGTMVKKRKINEKNCKNSDLHTLILAGFDFKFEGVGVLPGVRQNDARLLRFTYAGRTANGDLKVLKTIFEIQK